jgi:LysM repeat protein
VPTPDATVPTSVPAAVSYDSTTAAPQAVDLGTPAVTYSPASPSGYAAPTRPGSPAAAAISPARSEDVAPASTYTVGKGDSLWSIAKKNHLSVAELAKANNLSTGSALKPGKKLIVPGKVAPVAAAPKDLGTAMAAPATVAADKAAAPAGHGGGEVIRHTVQPGESLGVIARKYQVSTGELAAANSITDPSKVRAGQQLIIPGFKTVGTKGTTTVVKTGAAATVKPAATPTPGATPPAPAAPHFEIAAPPPGQDLDAGLKDASTEVPTIKVEEAKADPAPKK